MEAVTPYAARVQALGAIIKAKDRVIEDLLPRHANAKRFKMVMFQECQRNPRLMECLDTPAGQASLIGSMLEAFRLGLEPGGVTGECWIVPRKEKGVLKANLDMGYRGFTALAWRSGRIHGLSAGVVYEGDDFDYQHGTDAFLRHKPSENIDLQVDEKITHFYAVVKHDGGNYDFKVLTKAQVDAIREKAPSRNSPAWVHFYAEMGMAKVVKRLMKLQPLSPELAAAITYADQAEVGMDQGMDAVPVDVVASDPSAKHVAFLRSMRSQAMKGDDALTLEDLDAILKEEGGGDAWPRPTSGEDEAETAFFSALDKDIVRAVVERLKKINGLED